MPQKVPNTDADPILESPDDLMIPNFLYGTAWKEERSAALTELAIRQGFRGIDTANQRKHYNEAGVGEGIRAAYDAGVVVREDLFLQTKYTYQAGQDHRLPYDPAAPLSQQVTQSLASSLEHLGTDYVESFVLHGPSSAYAWTDDDTEVWRAMIAERDAGRAILLGVSNVSIKHLQQLVKVSPKEIPSFVQNRCFARLGWDREIRDFCDDHDIVYQGFSLITGNPEVMTHPPLVELAHSVKATPAQLIFRVAQLIDILPLTGTSDPEHMAQDLASRDIAVTKEIVAAVESIAG